MEEKSSYNRKINVKYFLNDNSEENNLTIEIEKDSNFITHKSITHKFFNSLKNKYTQEEEENIEYKNIVFEFIRYLDRGCWLFLERNEFIYLDDIDNLELMIKATIISREKERIKQLYDKKKKEINYMKKKLVNISKEKFNNRNNDICSNTTLDLIVLNANPLMKLDQKGEQELRTMNDYDKIPNLIHEAIKDSLNSISVEFYPLTKERLKEILSNKDHKPSILHLICKSTYCLPENNDIPEGKDSKDYVNIIFEKEDYNAEFINKDRLEIIMNSDPNIEDNIKDITLIISTPLAEDVFEMFNFEKYKFRNILVQPTTLSDIDYISNFNYNFYSDLINSEYQDIQDIYEDALNSYIDPSYDNIFCCCFHSHEIIDGKICPFMKSLQNELYNIDNNEDKMTETIPHFCHLGMTGQSISHYDYKKNFCTMHKKFIFNKFKEEIKNIHNETSLQPFINICCCKKELQKEKYNNAKEVHNINNIFFKQFNEGNKLLKLGGKNISDKKKYIPDFSKMNLLVGKNKIVYEAIKFIQDEKEKKTMSIYCYENEEENNNEYTTNDLINLANIIIEYIKERTEENEIKENIRKINKISSSFRLNKKPEIFSETLKLRKINSSPINSNIKYPEEDKIHFELMDLIHCETDKIKEFPLVQDTNKIYFILLGDFNSKKLLNNLKFINNKRLIFSLVKIDGIKIDKEIKIEKF